MMRPYNKLQIRFGIQNIFARYNEDVKSRRRRFDLELLEEAVKATDDYIGENTLQYIAPIMAMTLTSHTVTGKSIRHERGIEL